MIRSLVKLLTVVVFGVGLGIGLLALVGLMPNVKLPGMAFAQTGGGQHPPAGSAPTLECSDCHGNHPEPGTYQETPPPDADTIPCFVCHEVSAGFKTGDPGTWKNR